MATFLFGFLAGFLLAAVLFMRAWLKDQFAEMRNLTDQMGELADEAGRKE